MTKKVWKMPPISYLPNSTVHGEVVTELYSYPATEMTTGAHMKDKVTRHQVTKLGYADVPVILSIEWDDSTAYFRYFNKLFRFRTWNTSMK